MKGHRSTNRRGQVLTFGWYGSEHPGDIAILGDLIWRLGPLLGNPRFVLASSDVQHTRCLLTAAEGWPELPAVVEARLRSALRVIAHSDLVIIGGGPLMEDSTAMAGWLRKVRLAKFVRKPVVVYGCGVGPFHSAEAARDIVRICEQASLVILRDDPSAALLTQAGYSGKAHIAADPSIAYLEKRLGEPA
ncbi:MAG: hypothetical protein GTO55_11425, partial [Armatimonadetes bacterium]|nr:hypothetical protein [Armatimonadota bacterium]NIM24828.1 hypothetical protein [Armatimonadota bacterium]NIM68718.1 hypothetical protein [Armatimonadota bacterium]NIM76011.1 hypothetical protein [Armatimonadota bacterium]NIN06915.1 hypothetical protein [Armatimonadota bacterium]